MMIKQVGKIVLGAELNPKEQQALDIEIRKATAEFTRAHSDEIDAMFLWWLHEKLGFGYERLKNFHHEFGPQILALCDRYEMNEDGDDIWLCTKKLKDYDSRIDIRAWNDEVLKEINNVRKNP